MRKGYFANLAMNLQSSSPEGFATRDLQGNLLSIPKIKQFLDDSERKSVALHIDVKDESKDNGMKSIITSLPLEDGLERLYPRPKAPILRRLPLTACSRFKDEVDSQLNHHSGTGNGLLC